MDIDENEGFDETDDERDSFALALSDPEDLAVLVCPNKEYVARDDRLSVSVLLVETVGSVGLDVLLAAALLLTATLLLTAATLFVPLKERDRVSIERREGNWVLEPDTEDVRLLDRETRVLALRDLVTDDEPLIFGEFEFVRETRALALNKSVFDDEPLIDGDFELFKDLEGEPLIDGDFE